MTRRLRAWALPLGVAAAVAATSCGAGPRPAPGEAGGASSFHHTPAVSDTVLRHLDARVRAHDFSVQNEVRGLGDRLFPQLSRLAEDRDAETRSLALLCLEVSNAQGAGKVLGEALSDPSADVRLAASQVLGRTTLPTAMPFLVDAVRRNSDPGIRRNAALAAGKYPNAQAAELAEAARHEKDPDVRLASTQARARLGDIAARREFLAGLRAAQGQVRSQWLDRSEYIGQSWVLPGLTTWLGDKNPARRIGADNMPGPQYLRVCDVVLNLATNVAQTHWTFKTGPALNYSDAELKEARLAWAGLR